MPACNSLRLRALLSTTILAPLFLSNGAAHGEQATLLPPVDIASPDTADTPGQTLNTTKLSEDELRSNRAATNDTARLFNLVPGVSLYNSGGVSSLPAIHGMGSDRVNLLVNGMQVGVACANQMNSPLSYIDPANVGTATVMAGITPVSLGGDSISGTISVDSPAPKFSTSGALELSGQASIFYRSNAHIGGGSVKVTAAGENFSLNYTGAKVAADNYKGGSGDGIVRSSEYSSMNHDLTAAFRSGGNLFVVETGLQYIPRQGYPNQYMDMTHNRSVHVNGRYEGAFDWGTLEARGYWRSVRHQMNLLEDKGGTATGGMPMNTKSTTAGYTLKATILLGTRDTLHLGNELVHMALDDWWPPVPTSMMMSPNTYININDAKRDRLGTFAEWTRQWDGQWSTLLGLRNDIVWMNTGDVAPYSWTTMMSMPDAMGATAFNTAAHKRTNNNIDATALVRYRASAHATYEFGYARKSRAPNLYERYSWGRSSMASRMIGWFGDGNGYVGNLNLEPEVAHTVSATADWKGDTATPWAIKVTPYYTRIENYIDATLLKPLTSPMGAPTLFVQLQFTNHEAEIYGVDLAGSLGLWQGAKSGKGVLKVDASWLRGKNLDSGDSLYHMMPPNAKVSLEHSLGGWQSTAELVLVARKSRIDPLRHEPETAGYALINLRGSYSWGRMRIDAAIENLLNTAYDLPLGGMSLGDYKATGILRPVPGMGRSFNIALTASF